MCKKIGGASLTATKTLVAAKKENKKVYIKAFLLAALTAALFIVPFMLKGSFYIGSDFVHQQVPFWSYANGAVKSGDVLWSDKLDLGTQFIGGLSFYGLGSPFFWLSLLFPASAIPYLMGPLLILKCGVAGLTACLWMRRYTKTDQAALLGSLLYAFCGFQISNLNFNHFADVVALFPLLLWALDSAVLDKKKFRFVFAVALCALCNWFCFFGEVIFLILYVAVKIWCKEYKFTRKIFFQLAGESLLGVGISAVLLVPSILFMLANPRVVTETGGIASLLLMKPIYFADLIRGMLLPPECGFYRAFFLQGLFNGGELYLPLFGMVGAAAYIFTHRKSFEARLLGISLVFMLVPVLNSIFVAFNAEYYTRWFFMPSLILALATCKAVEDKELSLKRGYIFYGILWVIFGAIFVWFTYYFKVTFFYNIVSAFVYITISVAGFVFTLFLRRIQKLKQAWAVILVATIAFASATGLYNIYLMQKYWQGIEPTEYYNSANEISLPNEENYYRADADGNLYYNIGTMAGFPGMDSFSSTVSPSIFSFYTMCGEPRSVISDLPAERYGYRAFLSAKYWVRYKTDDTEEILGWSMLEEQGNFYILENEYALPLGFTYEYYITPEQLNNIPVEQRHLVLLKALVVEKAVAEETGLLEPLPEEKLADMSETAFIEDVENHRKESAKSAEKTNQGYTVEIELPEDRLVFFSIPWDEGWTAQVNGKDVEIVEVSGGFMAVEAQTGENEIVFSYSPQGAMAGLVISATSIVLVVGWIGFFVVKRKKNKKS